MTTRRTILAIGSTFNAGPGPNSDYLDISYAYSYNDRVGPPSGTVTAGNRDVLVPFDSAWNDIVAAVTADFIAFVIANTAPAGSGLFTAPPIHADEIVVLTPDLKRGA